MMFTNIMKALSTSPISLGQPWLIDISHLLLVISASCNVVIYTAQVGSDKICNPSSEHPLPIEKVNSLVARFQDA